MNKDNEYRENAAECERMARLTATRPISAVGWIWLDIGVA